MDNKLTHRDYARMCLEAVTPAYDEERGIWYVTYFNEVVATGKTKEECMQELRENF